MKPLTLMAILSFLLTVLPAVAQADYDTYYISASTGSDETGNGTMALPWASITYTLTEIAPTEIRPATLYLAAGSYSSFDSFPEHIDLSGGYNPENWEQDYTQFPSYVAHLATAASGTFSHVGFSGNLSGLDIMGGAFVYVEDCEFYNNRAAEPDLGSGVRMFGDCSGSFARCLFRQNDAGFNMQWGTRGSGGAVQHKSSGTAEFVECSFTRNNGMYGGAIYAVGSGFLICRDCVFWRNGCSEEGSGTSIYSTLQGGTTLINCLFDEYPGGGGMDNLGSGERVTECSIVR